MYTVGELAKRFNLSRSTLLYYESIGLLTPSIRSTTQYRLYSDVALRRLEQICIYRQAGLSLKEMASVLDTPGNAETEALERRLSELNREIGRLRKQQQVIVRLLESRQVRNETPILNKDNWNKLLHSIGLSEAEMHQWHREFERLSPEAHQGFLESLGIPPEDIARIRKWAEVDLNP